MESMSINPGAAAIGSQLVDVASRALGSGAAALPSLTGLVPAALGSPAKRSRLEPVHTSPPDCWARRRCPVRQGRLPARRCWPT